MKKSILFLSAAFFASLVLFFSCEPFDSPNTDDPRDNFTGNWTVNEDSKLYGKNTYSVTITTDPTHSARVVIKNFYHFGFDVDTYAIPTTSTITIPEQEVCNHTVKGLGVLSKSKIEFTYTASDGADNDEVTAVYTRQ